MKEKWFALLTEGNKNINIERVDSISDINGYEVLEYVLRTIEYLDTKCPPSVYNNLIRKALQWSEVAKCGTKERRNLWKDKNINLAIHNLGSADIYNMYSDDDLKTKERVRSLIRIHGDIGQFIRGEKNNLEEIETWISTEYDLLCKANIPDANKELITALTNLTASVVSGVSEELWNSIAIQAKNLIENIVSGEDIHMSKETRIKKMKPNFSSDNLIPKFNKLMVKETFWYPEIALDSFSDEIFMEIINYSVEYATKRNIRNINFKPISDFLYYDYQGKKHVNVYKKRIVESLFKNGENKHIQMTHLIVDNVVFIGFKLSKTCEKLVDFCNEAEISGDINYEQAIVMLFDFFDFRHDTFDRLNNEDYYLSVMDDISTSRKGELVNYVVGNTVVDVGSGSGVLLNLLEERFPQKNIIGTDISSEVIDKLKKKSVKEGHSWNVDVHNFVDSKYEKCDTIIFSSILHEIFSYTDTDEGRFNIESVKSALKNAYDSIPSGGRIIIRDGVKTDSKDIVKVHLYSDEAKDFFLNYLKDFKGLKEYNRSLVKYEDYGEYSVVEADINFIREFMYTYTWGTESYFNEVKEQFGYFTLNEFKEFFEKLGANVLKAESYLEEDYFNHLNPLLRFTNSDNKEIKYPDSNCIIVIEKP